MSDGATGGSAASRSHGLSPWRVAFEKQHEALLAASMRTPAPPESSVTLSRNAKGVAQFEVVVRGPDVEQCDAMARLVFKGLAESYPYQPNGGQE